MFLFCFKSYIYTVWSITALVSVSQYARKKEIFDIFLNCRAKFQMSLDN